MRTILHLMLLLSASYAMAQQPEPLSTRFPVKWKTKIGYTSYRTNILLHNGKIVVGSNGTHFKDYYLDSGNGVYVLNAANGKQLQHMAGENYGDMDVNGVVADGDRLYFGNDNEEFLCYTITGKLIWRVPVSGDVEAEPVLMDINGDCINDVVFATEAGEVAALDGRDGTARWSFKIADFSGWKKTDNRFVFKVAAWFSNGPGFMAKPAVADLNHDGVNDLVYSARDNNVYAINGKTGSKLWSFSTNSTFNAITPLVVKSGNTQYLCFPMSRKVNDDWVEYLVCVNEQGAMVNKRETAYLLSYDGASIMDNGDYISANYDSIIAVNPISGAVKKGKIVKADAEKDDYYNRYSHQVTARPHVLDLMGLGSKQIVTLDQGGVLQVIDRESLVLLRTFQLPDGTETTPLIADIDKDGKLEMLVACYDGYLYCFSLGTSSKSLYSAL